MIWAPPVLRSIAAAAAQLGVCATLISALGVLVVWVLRRQPADLRHAAAISVLASITVAPFVVAYYQVHVPLAATSLSQRQTTSATRAIPKSTVERLHERVSSAVTAAPAQQSRITRNGYVLMLAIWLSGISWRLAQLSRGFAQRRAFAQTWHAPVDLRHQVLVDQLARMLGIRRRVTLKTSSVAPWAFTLGVRRPMIVLPEELMNSEQPSAELQSVLLHELAHVRRCDYASSLSMSVLHCLYWWNPLLSRLAASLAAAREELCDRWVVRYVGDGEPLAQYLVASIVRTVAPSAAMGLSAVGNDAATLKQRIHYLLNGEDYYMRSNPILAVVVPTLLAGLSLGLVHVNYAHAELLFSSAEQAPYPLNNGVANVPLFISVDGLTFYSNFDSDVYSSTRSSVNSPWGAAVEEVGFDEPSIAEFLTWVSPDGLEAYGDDVGGNPGPGNIWRVTRATTSDAWSEKQPLGDDINTLDLDESVATLTTDGLTMMFYQGLGGTSAYFDLWEARRASMNDRWVATEAATLNSEYLDRAPYLSGDGLRVFFDSDRPGGYGSFDVYTATRASIDEPWSEPVNLGPSINSAAAEVKPVYWEQGKELYFRRVHPITSPINQIYIAHVVPEPYLGMQAIACVVLFFGLLTSRRH